MVLNFDQTPVGFASPDKSTFSVKGAEIVPIVNADDKRQITGTFEVSLSGEFLPLIYGTITDRYEVPNPFHITHSSNHWSKGIVRVFTKNNMSRSPKKASGMQSSTFPKVTQHKKLDPSHSSACRGIM